MQKIFQKNQILTIPNLLSLVRLLLIPLIVWLYVGQNHYLAAAAVIVLSGLTDIADGIIARKFHMVSDFGKILDPVADKVTQGAILLCLGHRFPLIFPLVIVFVLKECIMSVMGIYVIRKVGDVKGANWYGKANTVFLYAVMMLLILWPTIYPWLANTLIILCFFTVLASFFLYVRFYCRVLAEHKTVAKEQIV